MFNDVDDRSQAAGHPSCKRRVQMRRAQARPHDQQQSQCRNQAGIVRLLYLAPGIGGYPFRDGFDDDNAKGQSRQHIHGLIAGAGIPSTATFSSIGVSEMGPIVTMPRIINDQADKQRWRVKNLLIISITETHGSSAGERSKEYGGSTEPMRRKTGAANTVGSSSGPGMAIRGPDTLR